jgi:hypothetical protein
MHYSINDLERALQKQNPDLYIKYKDENVANIYLRNGEFVEKYDEDENGNEVYDCYRMPLHICAISSHGVHSMPITHMLNGKEYKSRTYGKLMDLLIEKGFIKRPVHSN